MNLVVEAADVERPISGDDGRLRRPTGYEFPLLRAFGRDGVDLLVLAAEIDGAV
jgi:hypothetical protein